ncbi:beta-hydroxyacyl-ACP dehydratase [Trinickia dabaoshanensis]|uniref:Beta-hydroxyacyl-ACP dehydratase n=1 Tax=Trinickia dabaoshanensis TaxID=564714 RepID=A0A2N7VPQ7_9BURK|nr:hotdog family protein [Trinickia dabaoshanensis]PMS19107.1 beta-hydroxyacyl-ACP dehydratase [Trinickia dabaoshanensis]
MTTPTLSDCTIGARVGAGDSAFPPIEDVLPHRGTMRLVDEIVACSDDAVTVLASVAPEAWYADAHGAMPAWLGIELMAQAIAAHVGLNAMRAGGRARPGVLLGASRYEAHSPSFAAGARLRIEAKELLKSEQGHGAYDCTIADADRCLAQAVVKVFQPNDFQAFIEGSFRS